ncbi:MAG: helix-turn-helix domain-containing protein [Clostridiales bacterium]|jgi:transcriptional regulator with XRE-family HTH domain|nr:helix-turn-helix domain-containing protein [Clostridiales bacterium]
MPKVAKSYEPKLDKKQFNVMIGQNVRKQRIYAKYSIEEISKILGLSPAAVGLMERGDRGITSYNLYKLAGIFGISVGAFYDDSEVDPPSTPELRRRKTQLNRLTTFTNKLSDGELEHVVLMTKNLSELERN